MVNEAGEFIAAVHFTLHGLVDEHRIFGKHVQHGLLASRVECRVVLIEYRSDADAADMGLLIHR